MQPLDPNRLFIGRPASRKTEYTSMGTWLFLLGLHIGRHYPQVNPVISMVHESRIVLMRNLIAKMAKEEGCGRILMVDPDAWPDLYVKKRADNTFADRFRPFFDAAWAFMDGNRMEMGPMVLASPARGCSPQNDVQVFRRTERDQLVKIPCKEAAGLTGWHRVGAVGTHLMLIDTDVFSRMDHPYFEDVYTDNTHTKLWRGQDVMFCRKCTQLNIPVMVNFDCWSGHWQDECVQMPGMEQEPLYRWSEAKQPPQQPTPEAEPNYTVLE